jgi:hypothetical protein
MKDNVILESTEENIITEVNIFLVFRSIKRLITRKKKIKKK